jgi:hypothetical protein
MRLPNLLNSKVYTFFHDFAIEAYYFKKNEHLEDGFSMSCSCQKSYYYSILLKFMSVSFISFVFMLFASTALSYFIANRDGSFILFITGS